MAKNPYIQYNGLDGESEGLDELKGLARLSPYFYIGGNDPAFMTVTGYDALFPEDEPIPLKQFRVSVGELSSRGDRDLRPSKTIFDLDTRHLYFGQNGQSPYKSHILVGEANGGFPEGNVVAGLPVRLQQVHFRAFNPSGYSDEYSAFFLVSDPISGFDATYDKASVSPGDINLIDSDYKLHKQDAITTSWTKSDWSDNDPKAERERLAVESFEQRLVIGNSLTVKTSDRLAEGDYFPQGDEPAKLSDLEPDPHHNVLALNFDTGTLFVKQDYEGAPRDPERHNPDGWNYNLPMEVYVAGKVSATPGPISNYDLSIPEEDDTEYGARSRKKTEACEDCFGEGSEKCEGYDGVDITTLDNNGNAEVVTVLTRPEVTSKFNVITSVDGENWTSYECPIFFGFKLRFTHGDDTLWGPVEVYMGYVWKDGDYYEVPTENVDLIDNRYLILKLSLVDGVIESHQYIYIDDLADFPESTEDTLHYLIGERMHINLFTCPFLVNHILGSIYVNNPDEGDDTGTGSGGGGTGSSGGEILNFPFKVTKSGNGKYNIAAGKIFFHNVGENLDRASAGGHYLHYPGETNTDFGVGDTLYLKVYRHLGEDTTQHGVQIVTGGSERESDDEGGSSWIFYEIATIESDGIIQHQLGHIYDENLPPINTWPPAYAGRKGIDDQTYNVLQVESDDRLAGSGPYVYVQTLKTQGN